MLPPCSAILLWKSYGGSIYPPELLTLALGHMLNAGLTIALAAAMASMAEHPSTAAILTLGVTVGTWIRELLRGGQGRVVGARGRLHAAAMVAEFQHGLVRLDVVLIAAGAASLAGLVLAAIWMRLGVAIAPAGLGIGRRSRRWRPRPRSSAASLRTTELGSFESRGNSFSEADERALAKITTPLRIESHLAPEDPRRIDLEHRALSKLRRVMPHVDRCSTSRQRRSDCSSRPARTTARSGTTWAAAKTMSRVTTAEGVLETIYALAGVAPPAGDRGGEFRGHPLAVPPQRRRDRSSMAIWPALLLVGAFVNEGDQMKTQLHTEQLRCSSQPLLAAIPLVAADIKVDLSKEQVGKPPVTFEPMVGTWIVAQDGPDKVDHGRRAAVGGKQGQSRPSCSSKRRAKLYGTSNEELMDNAKQFAYYPVAVLKGVDNFSNGTISMKFKTMAGDADRCSGILVQREAERRLAGGPLQRHREQRRAVGVPQRHPPQRQVQRPREAVPAGPRRLA